MPHILFIEDDDAIRMALEDDFSYEGYEVLSAVDGKTGLESAMDPQLDVIVLDVMLPEMNGFDVCKELRNRGIRTPIIMLSAKGQEIDKVIGLEFGADDYVTKPYSSRELHARVKAQLRRTGFTSTPGKGASDVVKFGDLVVHLDAFEVYVKNELIQLTLLEFRILKELLLKAGNVVSRDELLEGVWGENVIVTPRTIDTHVWNLRKKIRSSTTERELIQSVRGVGYRFTNKES